MKYFETIERIHRQAEAEGRMHISDPDAYYLGSNEVVPTYDLTEAEKAELAEAKRADEAEHKANEEKQKAKKAEAKARKEARDLANGITPEMRKAMTYSRRYATQIEELEAQLTELKAKKAYWDKVAQG